RRELAYNFAMEQVISRVSAPHIGLSMPSLVPSGRAGSPRDPKSRLQVALLLSLVVHAAVLALVGVERPARIDPSELPLIVDLVNARTEQAPKKPDILAQANLDGGGNTDAERRAKSPLPAARQPEPKAMPEVAVPKPRAVPKPQAAAPAPKPRAEPRPKPP